ncbi:MAG: hypothetical protein CML55_00810 [Rhodobacteraceae bacterium]|nr:hypothetical protein [Paracoccaceae bacterium]
MAQNGPHTAGEGRRARRRGLRRAGLWLLAVVLSLAAMGVLALIALTGRPLSAPEWLETRIEERLAEALPQARVTFGDIVLIMDEGWRPRIRLSQIDVRSPGGGEIVRFNEVKASLSLPALLDGQLQPREVALSGIFLRLRRGLDGRVSLSAGPGAAPRVRQAATLPELVGQIDALFDAPALSALRQVSLRALTLRYEDARTKRGWTVDGGRMQLRRDGDALALSTSLALLSGRAGVATLSASYTTRLGTAEAQFGVSFDDIAAADIAAQGPAFAWLGALDAPISGSVRSGLTAAGRLQPLNAALEIGAGALQPEPGTAPIPFDGARSYFVYEPEAQLLRFDDLSVRSPWVSGRMTGEAQLEGIAAGRLDRLIAQLQLRGIVTNPADLYAVPVSLAGADVDLQLQLDPFRLRLGRLQIDDGGSTLTVEGHAEAGSDGWNVSVDAGLDTITPPRLLELWPTQAKPKTRRWLEENLKGGKLSNVDVAVRLAPGAGPRTYLAFEYADAEVRFMKTMPHVQDAHGHASLLDNRFVLGLDAGRVIAPQGGAVNIAGSSFIMPDVRVKGGPPAVVRLHTESTVTAALSLLNQPPMRVMDKVKLPVTLADGRAELDGTLSFPLRKGGKPEDVTYHFDGTLSDLSSDTLVKDRTLRVPNMTLAATNERLTIAGEGRLDGIGFDARWSQRIGPGSDSSTLTGQIALSPHTLEAFGILLPPGSVSGEGKADISLALKRGRPPAFTLTSDLRGLRIEVPQVTWAKTAAAGGALRVEGTLGETPEVSVLRIEGPGLAARGSVRLKPGGALDRLRFDRVVVGDWLDLPLDLVGQGKGQPVQVVVRGGMIDMRRDQFGKTEPSGKPTPPMLLSLDRLQITDTIALTEMRGRFDLSRGLDGSFEARVNGGTALRGQVLPLGGRSAIRLASEDAGGVLRSASVARQVVGGDLTLVLVPVGSGGAFDGQLQVGDLRIRDAPAIAALLNAVSVVGLINELNGDGIYFDAVEAAFRLTPDRLTLTEASATGASMGISMDGVYALDSGRLALQGVVSPVYMLNSIGGLFTRKGEGLFGFSYALGGTVKAPEVSVNPLSALTPGMFRDLFRSDPPELPPVAGEEAPAVRPPAGTGQAADKPVAGANVGR